ncbi:hypothetical protein NHX12_022847 [Muraenolepis orangiensis]|uniref:Cystatin domain-containing protein n=1 Tax=Muraenolepis orangiensis TaxID=630683 RepID=A0A9Q0ERU3_9TELE|nr:hypothetical protein NHX12_022847 [Muraenolepis orangiensis]
MVLEKVLLLVSLLTLLEGAWPGGPEGAWPGGPEGAGERGEAVVPGAPSNASNQQELNQAVLVATYSFNNRSNDAFLFRTSQVDNAQRQIVKGIRYILQVRISRTVCLKRQGRDPLACDLQPEGLLQRVGPFTIDATASF